MKSQRALPWQARSADRKHGSATSLTAARCVGDNSSHMTLPGSRRFLTHARFAGGVALLVFRHPMWLVVACGIIGACFAKADELSELAIPIDKPSPRLAAATRALDAMLEPLKPELNTKVSSLVTKEGRFVLYGHLFGKSGIDALVEIAMDSQEAGAWGDQLVGFARYNGTRWELRELWDIPTVWRPEGWKAGDDDYLPITPAKRPFKLADLSGDGVPEVVVAGEVGKYYQAHYLFRFQSKEQRLVLVASAMAEPTFAGGLVRLDQNSGRRAIWGESGFHQWQGDKLIQKASWHDEVPYNNVDAPFVLATRMTSDGKNLEFRLEGVESEAESESAYQITREGRLFAKVTFKWPKPLIDLVGETYNAFDSEYAYLFEKLSGLPRSLYPAASKERPIMQLEKSVKIHVEGEPVAVEMLSPSHR